MSNGIGFPGPDGGPPDLEQPPAYIEGQGGGPAMPGGGFSSTQKEGMDETADEFNYSAAGIAGIAAGGMLVGASVPFVGLVGVLSAVAWLGSQLFSDLAEDPPNPRYKDIVTFQPRLSRPPGMIDPILSHLGIASQRGVFTLVTAGGLLGACERLAGAQQAGDLNWAITHYGVASQCYQTLVVDVATVAAALNAAAQALSGSKFDLPLKPTAGGVRKWIESPGTIASITTQMHEAGLLDSEIEAAIKWWKTDPTHSGLETTGSGLLLSSAKRLYESALKLA